MRLTWQQIASTVVSDILSRVDLDGVVLDTEHGCYSNETLFNCIQVVTGNKKKCFVRLTEVNATLIRLCLDAGADGLIFSTVETMEQSEKIIELCKYPKDGGRRGLGLVRQNNWGEGELISESPILVAQIETEKGVRNLGYIAGFDMFDYYMVGPYDLSASLGVPAQFDSEEYLQALKDIREIVPDEQMAIHIPKNIDEEMEKYKSYGVISIGMDTTMLIEGYKKYGHDRH